MPGDASVRVVHLDDGGGPDMTSGNPANIHLARNRAGGECVVNLAVVAALYASEA